MSQTIEVETKAEQQGLTLLREQGVAEGASRELTLYPEQSLRRGNARCKALSDGRNAAARPIVLDEKETERRHRQTRMRDV